RRGRGEKSMRHLVHPESAEQLEHQRDLHGGLEPRVAAGEHHPQLLAAERVLGERRVDGRRQIVLQAGELGREPGPGALLAQQIQSAVARHGPQPGSRVVRHASHLPHFEGVAERLLHHVLGQVQVRRAEDADENGRKPPRLVAKEVLHHSGRSRRGHIFRIGRTSTDPSTSRIGHPRASSAASSRFSAVTKRYPPTRSFASAKGPSTIVFFLPLTCLPPASSGSPPLNCPRLDSSPIQLPQACMCFCICSGEKCWVPLIPPRNTYRKSAMACSFWSPR